MNPLKSLTGKVRRGIDCFTRILGKCLGVIDENQLALLKVVSKFVMRMPIVRVGLLHLRSSKRRCAGGSRRASTLEYYLRKKAKGILERRKFTWEVIFGWMTISFSVFFIVIRSFFRFYVRWPARTRRRKRGYQMLGRIGWCPRRGVDTSGAALSDSVGASNGRSTSYGRHVRRRGNARKGVDEQISFKGKKRYKTGLIKLLSHGALRFKGQVCTGREGRELGDRK